MPPLAEQNHDEHGSADNATGDRRRWKHKKSFPMNMFEGCRGKALNNSLRWLNEPPQWHFTDGGCLTIVPKACADFFRPHDDVPHDDACLLYAEVSRDFTAVTTTRAELVGFGDAAAMTVRSGGTQWAKLCVERSPIGEISMVSVVTNESTTSRL